MNATAQTATAKRWIGIMGACFLGLVLLSWFRLWYVGTPNLDGLPMQMPWEVSRRTVMFFLMCGSGWAFLRLLKIDLEEGELRTLLMGSLCIQLLLLFCLPLTSNDIFANLAYGKMDLLGIDADQLGASALPVGDAFRRMVTARWMTTPMVYGPVIGWINRLVVRPDSLWASMAIYKLAALLFSAVITALAYVYCRRFRGGASRCRSFVIFALNPVFLWELGAQAHNDAVMLIGIAGFMIFVSARFDWPALACIILAFISKLAVLPVIGLYLCYTFFASRRRFALFLLFLLVGGALAAYSFSHKLGIILVPPSGGGVDMTRLTNTPLYLVARFLKPAGEAAQLLTYKAYWTAAMLLAALLGARLAWRCRTLTNLFLFGFIFTVFFNLVASPTYQPWYCVWILPFAMALDERPLLKFVALYSFVSVAQYAILNSLSGSIINLGVLGMFLCFLRRDEFAWGEIFRS